LAYTWFAVGIGFALGIQEIDQSEDRFIYLLQ
jgi:hypothetical protein